MHIIELDPIIPPEGRIRMPLIDAPDEEELFPIGIGISSSIMDMLAGAAPGCMLIGIG